MTTATAGGIVAASSTTTTSTPMTRARVAIAATKYPIARSGAHAKQVSVRSSMTGAKTPVTAASVTGISAQQIHTRPSVRSRRTRKYAPAATTTNAASWSCGTKVTRSPTSWTIPPGVVRGIQSECPPLAWVRNVRPQSTAQTASDAASAIRHRHAARSVRRPARTTSPAPRRKTEVWVRSPAATSTPMHGACQDRGRRSQDSLTTAAATPMSSSSAYMRASRPCTSSNVLRTMRPVATIPATPRRRTHQANRATAPTEQSRGGKPEPELVERRFARAERAGCSRAADASRERADSARGHRVGAVRPSR